MKKHLIRLKSGEEVVLRETPEGAVCPVCGVILAGGPAYCWMTVCNGTPLSEPFGVPSFNTCGCCDTEYGNDDYVAWGTGSREAKWHELRLAWLDRVGWNDEAIQQLQRNLEIDPTTLRR